MSEELRPDKTNGEKEYSQDGTCGCHHHDHKHETHEHHHDHKHETYDHHHDYHEHDDHNHSHGHTYEVPGYRIVETHHHEGATICSFEKDLHRPAEEVKPAMESAIRKLETWLEEEGALIGHVKGYVRETGPVTTFSTTGSGLHMGFHEGSGLTVGFAAIVFGPEEEALKEQVLTLFENV